MSVKTSVRIIFTILSLVIWKAGYSQYSSLSDDELNEVIQKTIDLNINTSTLNEVYDNYFQNENCYLLSDSLAGRNLSLLNRQKKAIRIVTDLPLFKYKFIAIDSFRVDSKKEKVSFKLYYGTVATTRSSKDTVLRNVIVTVVVNKKNREWKVSKYKITEHVRYLISQNPRVRTSEELIQDWIELK